MFTCKQVSNSLAEHDYEKLSPAKKALLKFHVALCVVCDKYNKQIMVIQDGVRKFRQQEDEILNDPTSPALPEDRKAAIKEALHSAE